MSDTYSNYAELKRKQTEGVDYRIGVYIKSSPIVVLAPHGGSIEPHTSDIARYLAGATYNLYLFEGIKKKGNRILHITSTNFDEPKCVALVKSCELAVAVHGKNCIGEHVEVGGGNNDLAKSLLKELTAAKFNAREPRNPQLAGRDPQNICNKAKTHGVQLEMCRDLRKMLVQTANKSRLSDFVEIIRNVIESRPAMSNVR